MASQRVGRLIAKYWDIFNTKPTRILRGFLTLFYPLKLVLFFRPGLPIFKGVEALDWSVILLFCCCWRIILKGFRWTENLAQFLGNKSVAGTTRIYHRFFVYKYLNFWLKLKIKYLSFFLGKMNEKLHRLKIGDVGSETIESSFVAAKTTTNKMKVHRAQCRIFCCPSTKWQWRDNG